MKIKSMSLALAAKAAALALCASVSHQAAAIHLNTGWGILNINYYNYDGWGGTYRIAGDIRDTSNHDGACVYLRARQYSWTNYPIYYGGYTRTCSGGVRPYDFDVMYRMDVVELASENGASAIAWQR